MVVLFRLLGVVQKQWPRSTGPSTCLGFQKLAAAFLSRRWWWWFCFISGVVLLQCLYSNNGLTSRWILVAVVVAALTLVHR
jgi:hypothetical protein